MKFIRRQWRRRDDLVFEFVFEFVQRSVVSIEVTLQFPIIGIIGKRIKVLEATPLCGRLVKCLSRTAPAGPSPIKKDSGK